MNTVDGEPHADNIPPQLAVIVAWLIWKLEKRVDKNGEVKWTKPPYCAHDPTRHASTTDPGTWSTLEQALAAEERTIADYTDRRDQADAIGDIGLKVALENLIADEGNHKEEIERILTGWDDR